MRSIEKILLKNTTKTIEKFLDKSPLVTSVTRKKDRLTIKFVDGLYEHWYYDSKPPSSSKSFLLPKKGLYTEFEIPRYPEFESDPLNDSGDYSRYFHYSSKDFHRTGFVQSRLKVHEIICEISQWCEFNYPQSVLEHEYRLINNWDLDRCWKNEEVWQLFPGGPGRRIKEHFFPIGDVKSGNKDLTLKSMWKPNYIYGAIQHLICEEMPITIRNIAMSIAEKYRFVGTNWINFWRAIYRRYKISDIIDLSPGYGDKLIAASVEKVRYNANEISDELKNLMDFLKCNNSVGDLPVVILNDSPEDDDVRRIMSSMEEWSSYRRLIISSIHMKPQITKIVHPKSFVRVYTTPATTEHFLLAY